MRGKTIFAIENVYLVLLTGIFLIVLAISSAGRESFAWETGRSLFETVNYVQILLLVIASPTIVASAFTLEREQKTLDMLLATPLSLVQIARTKLLASLSVFFVLVLVSLPMLSVCFILGGVSPSEIFWAYFLTLEGILLAGAIGLCYSALLKRTLAAVPISSLTIIVFLIATLLIAKLLSPALGTLNPLYAFHLMTSRWTTKFFAFETPFWVPSLVLTSLLFLCVFSYTVEILNEEKRRTSSQPRALRLLFYCAMLLFLLSSTIEYGPRSADIAAGLERFVWVSYLFCVAQAIVVSGGSLSGFERKKLLSSWKEKCLRLKGWLGPGLCVGPRYSLLIAFMSVVIFSFGAFQVDMVKRRMLSILLVGCLFVTGTLTCAMLARFFSLVRRTKGNSLPRILASFCFLIVLVAPHLITYVHRRGKTEIPETAWDLSVFFSPLIALGYAVEPTRTPASYPYCAKLLGSVPFSVVTSLLYFSLLIVLWALNLRWERKIRLSTEQI